LEVVEALLRLDWPAAEEEWGDVGYYIAQGPIILWRLYAAITPERIIAASLRKFRSRAEAGDG